VFIEKDQAIGYAETRARLRTGEIRIFESTGNVERELRLTTPIADCDGGQAMHVAFRRSCASLRAFATAQISYEKPVFHS
jgi:hypothetical protein